MSTRHSQSEASEPLTKVSLDNTDASSAATSRHGHRLSPASSSIADRNSSQFSDASTRASRTSYAGSDRRTSGGLLLGSIFRKRQSARPSPGSERQRDVSGPLVHTTPWTVPDGPDMLQPRSMGLDDNSPTSPHSHPKTMQPAPSSEFDRPSRDQAFNPDHLVQVALSLSKGRARHASTSVPAMANQDSRRIRSTGSAMDTARSTIEEQRLAPQRQSSTSSQIQNSLDDAKDISLQCSEATLLRVTKAREYLEIADQYRRLLEHLSAPSTGQPDVRPGSEHADGREYNPIQGIRNRLARQREHSQLHPSPSVFDDPVQVATFVDDVEVLARRRLYRSDHDLLHLPRLPHTSSNAVDGPRTENDMRTQWTDSKWSITPMELFADTIWSESNRNKPMLEDRFGVPLYPMPDATAPTDDLAIKSPVRSATVDTATTPRRRHLWPLTHRHEHHKTKHLFRSSRRSGSASPSSSRSSSRESERAPLRIDKQHHRPRHGSTVNPIHLTHSPEEIQTPERSPNAVPDRKLKHGKSLVNLLEHGRRKRSVTHSRNRSESLSNSFDGKFASEGGTLEKRVSGPPSLANTDLEASDASSTNRLHRRSRGLISKLKTANLDSTSQRDFAEERQSMDDPHSPQYRSSLESMGSSELPRDSLASSRNDTIKRSGRVTRNVSALIRHGRLGGLRRNDPRAWGDESSLASDTERPGSRLAGLSKQSNGSKSQLPDVKELGGHENGTIRSNRPRYHVPLPSFRRADGTDPNVSTSSLSRLRTADSYADSDRTKQEREGPTGDGTYGVSRQATQPDEGDGHDDGDAGSAPKDQLVQTTRSDICQARALYLSAGIKVNEILRRADSGHGIFAMAAVTKGESRERRVSRQHVNEVLEKIGADLAQTNDAYKAFDTSTMGSQRSQLYRLRDDGVNSLTHDTFAHIEDADAMLDVVNTKYTVALKQTHDKIEDLMQLRRREFRWLRRLGFGILEQMVLGLLWIVWFVVITWKLVRGTACGVYRGARWLMSL